MGYNLFHRRGPATAESDSEFASTVASLPPGLAAWSAPVDLLLQPESEPEAQAAGPDSGLLDSLPAPADLSLESKPTLSHIGRYAIKGPLGQGGLGQVHEAWDPLLSRTVAVKTLHFDLAHAERATLDELFLNEARAAAGLSHPHIVTVHDAGLSPQGVYIAMERLHGRDLRQALDAGWQPAPVKAAQLVRRVADALAYAHARGVVHCDIKPGNIFLCRRNRPKVLDFGIARVANSAALPLLEGLVAGSPYYLAPEQLQGAAVDARTDIHALGVVFYELLAGRKAYPGDSVEQITNAVLNNHPAAAHEVRPGVPPGLSAIAARAMARDPQQRYLSASALSLDLRRWIDLQAKSEAAGAQDDPAAQDSLVISSRLVLPHTNPVRLRAAAWAGATMAGVAMVAGAGLATLSPSESPPTVAASASPAYAGGSTAPPSPSTATLPLASLAPDAPQTDAPIGHPSQRPVTTPRTPSTAAQAARRAPAGGTATAAADARPGRIAAPAAAAQMGTVQLAISPWGAIEVDGQAAGVAPPLSRLSLSEGTHTITVRNADFPAFTTTVQVHADKAQTVRHRFTP